MYTLGRMQEESDRAVVAELGRRLRAERFNQRLTQQELAARAGIRQATLSHIENGRDFSVETMVALLRALGRLDNLDAFLPEAPVSPIDLADRGGVVRQRVRAAKDDPATEPWAWGDG